MAQKATFGAGCFWGVEAAFRRLDGVTATAVGYAGGRTDNPSYQRGVLARDRPRRGGRGHLRPGADPVRAAARGVLGRARPDPARPAGAGRRRPVPLGDLRPRRGAAAAAEASRERVQARISRPVVTQIEDAPTVLAGRGLPPAVPREARPRELPRRPAERRVVFTPAATGRSGAWSLHRSRPTSRRRRTTPTWSTRSRIQGGRARRRVPTPSGGLRPARPRTRSGRSGRRTPGSLIRSRIPASRTRLRTRRCGRSPTRDRRTHTSARPSRPAAAVASADAGAARARPAGRRRLVQRSVSPLYL